MPKQKNRNAENQAAETENATQAKQIPRTPARQEPRSHATTMMSTHTTAAETGKRLLKRAETTKHARTGNANQMEAGRLRRQQIRQALEIISGN